jgi:hypothetical protein
LKSTSTLADGARHWRLNRAPRLWAEGAREGGGQGLEGCFLYQSGTNPDSMRPAQVVVEQAGGVGWINVYATNAYEVVVRNGPETLGEWLTERRDLGPDFCLAFGREVGAVCPMTNGDRTGALVEGWYGDITLQAR